MMPPVLIIPQEPFCMTGLALNLSCAANAVSELHGRVSRHIWHSLYPIIWTDVLEPYGTAASADQPIAVFGALSSGCESTSRKQEAELDRLEQLKRNDPVGYDREFKQKLEQDRRTEEQLR